MSTSKTSSAKKQKVGSLLQFGFAASRTTTETLSSSSPTSKEFVQCPLCCGLFTIEKIASHSSICVPVPNKAESSNKRNAFEIMKSSSALKVQEEGRNDLFFALVLKDEKLHPLIYYDPYLTKELYKNKSNEFNVWECDSNVRKLRVNFRCNGGKAVIDAVVHLSTNIPSTSFDSVDQFIPPNLARRTGSGSTRTTGSGGSPGAPAVSVALLKSMIQKAIRRKQTLKAVRLTAMLCDPHSPPVTGGLRRPTNSATTTAAMTAASGNFSKNLGGSAHNTPISELLRRIPIICLEDSALHPALPVVMWLMMAVSKGYNPPSCLIHIVLLIVADIASCPYKDCVSNDFNFADINSAVQQQHSDKSLSDPSGTATPVVTISAVGTDHSEMANTASTFSTELRSISSDAVRTLITSISLRASFGGMTGDMRMLDKYAELWYERLVEGAYCQGHVSYGCEGSLKERVKERVAHNLDYLHADYASNLSIPHVVDNSKNNDSSRSSCGVYEDWTHLLGLHSGITINNADTACATSTTATHSNSSTDLVTMTERMLLHHRCCQKDGDSDHTNTQNNQNNQNNHNLNNNLNNSQNIARILTVSAPDLVSEGLDNHVDFSLISYITTACRDRLDTYLIHARSGTGVNSYIVDSRSFEEKEAEEKEGKKEKELPVELIEDIQSAIWLFRSSSNGRKLFPLLASHVVSCSLCHDIKSYNKDLTDRDLAEKARLARLWAIICPVLVAYCERRMSSLAKRL